MTKRAFCGVLEALSVLARVDDPHAAAQAAIDATLCAAAADGALVTSLSDGVPLAAWSWPGDFFPPARQETLEAITATHHYPLITHTRDGPGWALRLSDILSSREYRAAPLYVDLLKELSIPQQVAFSVPTVTGRSLCVAIGRGGHDFTDRECEQLNALRGPLGIAARRGRPELPSPECVQPLAPLSGREREVLRLAASGLSDVQVGRRLGIATRTVGKHLENVYRKTQTTNRTEAAAQLRSRGASPPKPSDAFAGALIAP